MTEEGEIFYSGATNEALRLEAAYTPLTLLTAGLLGMTAGMFHGPINTIPEYVVSLAAVGVSTAVGVGISKIATRLIQETSDFPYPSEFPEFPGE